MKRLSAALAATALLALAGCGSRTANNVNAIDTSNDVYNVSPDDLTVNDLGNSGNGAMSGNMSSGGNASSGNSHATSSGNGSTSSHSSASHASRNTH